MQQGDPKFTSREFRELLFADVALINDVASARDIALAIQRFWERREEEGASLADELGRIAELDQGALSGVRRVVERLVSDADGDPRQALSVRGGIDQSLHRGLSVVAGGVRSCIDGGVERRVPLRSLDENRYQEFERIGEGGMGVVYRGLDTDLNRVVAFKVVRPDADAAEPADSPDSPMRLEGPTGEVSTAFDVLRMRFVQEAVVTSGLQHPGIAPVYELGETPTGVPYYTMHYVRGRRTLRNALDDARSEAVEGRLTLLEPFLPPLRHGRVRALERSHSPGHQAGQRGAWEVR